MSARLSFEMPQGAVWLLRLAANADVSHALLSDAVAFAGWYAVIGEVLDWPEDVLAIQRIERDKKHSLERMMKLLEQVNYVLASRVRASHARLVLEGYAVHEWASQRAAEFRKLANGLLDKLGHARFREAAYEYSGFARNVNELGTVLGLDVLERDILAFAIMTTGSNEIESVFNQLATDRWSAAALWPTVFGATRDELARAMRPDSPLRLSGILRQSSGHAQLAGVSPFWLDLLVQESQLFDAIVEPFDFKSGAGVPAQLSSEDQALAASILKASGEPGVNLLLYGAGSLDKRPVTRALVQAAGLNAWRVRQFEDAGRRDLPALTLVAFRLLADNACPVLLVERPDQVLQAQPSEFIRALFGIELNNADIPAFDEHLLANNSVPGIWFAPAAQALPDETVARFVFHAPLKKADKEARARHVQERIAALKLGKKATESILKLEGVSSAQLESAARAASLAGHRKKSERDAAIVQAVRRSQRALGRDLQARAKPSVTQYSVKYLNTAGRFGPADILAALKRNPRGSMVFYGPPGTGKTQFVEHMAAELGLPLVAKRASDLLSKWHGESEKNIAAAFEEAANEDAILFLDEGDSFLRDRSYARASWEVTQVNELLQHMERFDGIVVVCTNLFKGLDVAALRRFTFKVEFCALNEDQRWEMFVNEAGLKGQLTTHSRSTRDAWLDRLLFMGQLTAGDFATVKRQCDLLGTTLSPNEWLDQLQIECDVKAKPETGRELL